MAIAAFAMASAVFAQTEDKDAAWAAKAAAKAEKAQKAADLKAFKEKQKAELAAFIDAQKNGKKAFSMDKPAIESKDDSVAYMFGVAQSQGLKQYATAQLSITDEMMDKFAEGIVTRTNIDPEDKELAAFNAGENIGGQVLNMVENLSKEYFAADPGKTLSAKIVTCGLLEGLMDKATMTADSASIMFRDVMTARQEANKEALYGPNRTAGEKFLEENKKKEGVITLPSGLQYKIITAGTGETPKATDKVSVDYEGTLIDGTVFDSSYKRGKAAEFGVTQVIAGWTEALQLMPVGSKWELYIPYQLAYGDRETGKEIKPYSALIFTVELKDIVKPAAPAEEKTEGSAAKPAASKKTAKKK